MVADYEFKRLNNFVRSSSAIIGCLVEDSQMMQLMQENDLNDRQKIGLFGNKKNN